MTSSFKPGQFITKMNFSLVLNEFFPLTDLLDRHYLQKLTTITIV